MLGLPSRKGEKVNLFDPLMKNINERFGPQVAEMLKPTLAQLQALRDDLIQPTKFCSDQKMLERIIAGSKTYLSIWNSICQNFVFGSDKDNINVSFTWYDTYTGERRVSLQPADEYLAVLYNLGTLCNEMGVQLVNTAGDRFKEANNCFLTASWVFEKVRVEVVSRKIFSAGTDYTEQNLAMYVHLMNAQALYSTHEKVKLSMPDKYNLLAKLSKQTAVCYGYACKYSTSQPISQYASPKGFSNVLQVNERMYTAQAHYWACMDQQAKCESTGVGMGKAIANIMKANEVMEHLKGLEKNMNPIMTTQYKTLKDLYQKTQDFLVKKNNRVHFEVVPSRPDEIDVVSYGKPISIEQELKQPFQGQAILARMVPLPVQELEEEYKAGVRAIINEAFDVTNKIEAVQAEFLAKRNLPGALYAVSVEEDLPEDLWQKIAQCKMQCTAAQLAELISEAAAAADSNKEALGKLNAEIDKEEAQDKEMREKYGDKWTRQGSGEINGTIRKQLEYYAQKFAQGKEADDKVRSVVEVNQKQFERLEMDKADLIAGIPRSVNSSKFLSPSAIRWCWK